MNCKFLTGIIIVGFVAFSNCNRPNNKRSKKSDQTKIVTNKTSFDKAFFEGILPCADCNGIKRNILLNADHTFLMESIYLGKAGHPFKEKGTYTVSENFLILSIEAPNKYSIGEGYIEQMDVNGNRIISTLNYQLHRK
jgi:uncharacterized lipoprotein NlpE involved in copper resistance